MTALTLDVRGPIIVLVGAFNPAIFTPNWIATNIFDVPEGAEMSILEVVVQIDDQTYLRLSFLEGVAINVGPNRLELYVQSGNSANLTSAESALSRILDTLPHTPIQGIGCNFRWNDPDPTPKIIDLFDSPEGIEGQFKLQARQFSSKIDLEDTTLNFSRANVNNDVLFSFNYHRSLSGVIECKEIIEGLISQDLARSTEMMKSVYGYEQYEILEYAPKDDQEETIDAAHEAD